MGSTQGSGRGGKGGRRGPLGPRHKAILAMENLEARTLLYGGGPYPFFPANGNPADIQHGPLGNGGQTVVDIYQAYQQYLTANPAGTPGGFSGSPQNKHPELQIAGNSIAIEVHYNGTLAAASVALASAGATVGASSPAYLQVSIAVPISKLPTIAALDAVRNFAPIFKPTSRFQGVGNNQAELAMGTDAASLTYNVNGAGTTIGVISNSVNKVGGGLATSVSTGDIPKKADGTANVNVLLDGNTGDSDEGRAMLEEIYDIAPGASLAYSTADGGPNVFASSIINLANQAGSQVIVDDIGYLNEAFYQDGPIAAAINQVVTTKGVTYFTSAGNAGSTGGFESPFRGVSTGVTGIGTGRYMNFNPAGGSTTNLPLTVTNQASAASPALVGFQWDQPLVNGGGAASSLNIYVLDANNVVVASNIGNVKGADPFKFVSITAPGSYTVVVQVAAGDSDPGRIVLYDFAGGFLNFSTQFGSAGGISYPSAIGHPSNDNAISVGAVPFWAAGAPYQTFNPTTSEGFSSTGPGYKQYNPDGSRKPVLQVQQVPTVSAIDGVNTSFFPAPASATDIDTTNPPPGTGPATTVNYDPDTLPNFFGTSAAAPNLAALAALQRQLAPSSTPADIRRADIAAATPLNGAPAGTYNIQGGYGLVRATAALQAIDRLRVSFTNPPAGVTAVSAPPYLYVVFNKPVDPSTLQATDLVFTSVPAGVAVAVGAPLFNPAFPTIVAFPLLFNAAANTTANGVYKYTIAESAISTAARSGNVAYSGTLTINDVIAPRVTNVAYGARSILITFSEALSPATVNAGSIELIRTNNPQGLFGQPSNIILTNNPRVRIIYDAANNRVGIDLTGLAQSELPTDHYALVVTDAVRDIVGNRLDGEFSGQFPSGDAPTGGSDLVTPGGSFVQDLGTVVLGPPQINNLRLAPASDTGIRGDNNTNSTRPSFVGTVSNSFLGTVSGIQIVGEFNALHGSVLDLRAGATNPPRGFTGAFDVSAITLADGTFTLNLSTDLPNGFITLRAVAIGASDSPPLPGLSSQFDTAFRVDTTTPTVISTSLAPLSKVGSLSSFIFNFQDTVIPADLGNPQAVPTAFGVPALDPSRASNINNYSLYKLGPDNTLTGAIDFSTKIISAAYVDTTNRLLTSSPYTGSVTLSFAPGLPQGRYLLVARGPQTGFQGIVDAAGNPLDASAVTPGNQDVGIQIDLQPTPVYITSLTTLISPTSLPADLNATVNGGPRSYFEATVPGVTARAAAPPTEVNVEFSSPLPDINYNDVLQLVKSANGAVAASDGSFGDFGQAGGTGNGYTRVAGTTVVLTNSVAGATFGQPGYQNRLTLSIPAGTTLSPDDYRVYIPNTGNNALVDQFGNPLDGEFLGNPRSDGNGYEDLLPNGQYRAGLSGDGLPGGSFVTGFVVVPNGNIIYARPDYVDNPSLSTDDPDGSLLKPYPALAPEAVANAANGGNLNSVVNFGVNFDARYDRSGNGHFDRSALYAAQLASARGPVVVVALPASPGNTTQTFVLQAPAGTDPIINDGSASVPKNTLLAFAPGSTLKLRNASLFVQQQGASLETLGGPNPGDKVTFTSYSDDTVLGGSQQGDTNGDGNSTSPAGGDWGGIVFRNFDDTSNGGRAIPQAPGPILDPNNTRLGLSGADDVMSAINNARIRYAGGAVPQTIGFRFDAVTLFNSRPALTNDLITDTATGAGAGQGGQAAISGDLDSFREDQIARGPLIRRTVVSNNSLNGIYVRANQDGFIEPSDAMTYADNPAALGGVQNYTFDDPLPHIYVAQFFVGQKLQQGTGGKTSRFLDRIYFQPGTVHKFQRGAAIDMPTRGASISIGDRTYIQQFDANPLLSPLDPSFVPPVVGDAPVLFTSLFDDAATTAFLDPITGISTTIVPTVDTDNSGPTNLPTPGNVPALARWGGISITSGAKLFVDEAHFQYGGGSVNDPKGTIAQRDVLAFEGAGGSRVFGGGTIGAFGTQAYVTNNDFTDNQQAPISVSPDGLLAADPLRPLISGNPFFRGNILQRNDLNGLEVIPGLQNAIGYVPNLNVNSVWDDTDITYVLRGTIRPDGYHTWPTPPGVYTTELVPAVVLTIQSSLPDSLLANGQRIARPGESALVKLLNQSGGPPVGDGTIGLGNTNQSDSNGGAGFIVGYDDGVDGPADLGVVVDAGVMSQIRILGIGGNETTGQQRVPVIITSARDTTVGKTVRGVTINQVLSTDNTPAAAGDGGVIAFGANSLSDYNLQDPRDGSLIDNADIRYMTRIEQQGGGWVYGSSTYQNRLGTDGANSQYNTAKAMTVSNSNISNFSQVGFLAHPGFPAITALPGGSIFGSVRDTAGSRGQPTLTYFVNNSFTGSPVGVKIVSEDSTDALLQSPAEAIFLNNTFSGDDTGIYLQGSRTFSGTNYLAHVYAFAMDNIFDNAKNAGIVVDGQTASRLTIGPLGGYPSQGQYNLFNAVGAQVQSLNGGQFENDNPVTGNPSFRSPATGDYTLLGNSAAIDASRSEIGPINWGNSLQPIADQVLDGTGGIRNQTGRTNPYGGAFDTSGPGDLITLPGQTVGDRGFNDQFVAAIPGSPGSIPGPTSNAGGVFSYIPITGQRDQQGFLRQDDPGVGNVGFGANPFFDIGANEYRILTPPHVTAVGGLVFDNVVPGQLDPIPIYGVNTYDGTNKSLQLINITFDRLIDPATITNKTVMLQASGGDGIFGNGNSAADRFIDLSGKLAFDPASRTLSIYLAASNLTLANDEYRVFLLGNGANVLRDPQGNALDGENTADGTANGAQRALPSGDGFPGGNFYLTFTVDTSPPRITPGTTVALSPASDTNIAGDNITDLAQPSFTGTVTDIFPPISSSVGQTVYLTIFNPRTGQYENYGSAVTGAGGAFTVTADHAIPDSNYNVGPDGILGTPDDSGFTVGRVILVDQSGNVSNPNDPAASFRLIVDTKGPRITGVSPAEGAQVTPDSVGNVAVALAVNENIDPASLTAGSISVRRAGPDGLFGTGDDVTFAFDPSTVVIQYLHTAQGSEILRFNASILGSSGSVANDIYRVTLSGTGSAAVRDIAGNPLDGEFGGATPSGDGIPGGDFNLDFTVFSSASSKVIFVDASAPTTGTPNGARGNPYPTIARGLAAAGVGDTVAVLPGVYQEAVALKSLVRVVSVDPSSVAASLVAGNPLQTIIEAPLATGTAAQDPTVSATNLLSLTAFPTELAGFTILCALSQNPANGPINTGSIGVLVTNSDVLIDKNYVINAQFGIIDSLSGPSPRVARIVENAVIGNIYGISVIDSGATNPAGGVGVQIINNTVAYNTTGLLLNSGGSISTLAEVDNNIFWQNADLSGSRSGQAILATVPGRASLKANMFAANGPNVVSSSDDTVGVGGGFNPVGLTTGGDANGNFVGNPAFVRAIDPRPQASGPANFVAGASFDITGSSAAIDNAIASVAPPVDFLYRARVDIRNAGRVGYGPADVGAFEYQGTAGTTIGGGGTTGGPGTIKPGPASTASSRLAAQAAANIPQGVLQDVAAAAAGTAGTTTGAAATAPTSSLGKSILAMFTKKK